jgi:hypothetical protein
MSLTDIYKQTKNVFWTAASIRPKIRLVQKFDFFGNFRHPGRKKFMIEILGNTKISRFKVFLTTEVDHKTNFFKGGSVREKVRLKI